MSLMGMESVNNLINKNYLRLSMSENVTNGYYAIVSDLVELKENSDYILQFKCIPKKEKNIIIKIKGNETIEQIGEIILQESVVFEEINGIKEYLCVLRFSNTKKQKVAMMFGIENNNDFSANETIFDIREIALQEGELLLPYQENSFENNSKITLLNGKFELLADKFEAGISKVEKDITGLEEKTDAKIKIESDKITQEVKSVAEGNFIVNGAFETGDIFGWNVGGTRTIVEGYNYYGETLNYINIDVPQEGTSTWSNRFEVVENTYIQFSGLFFNEIGNTTTIKIKFSKSVLNTNDREESGNFDTEKLLETWIAKSNDFVEKFYSLVVPVGSKTAFIEIGYNGTGKTGWTKIMSTKGQRKIDYMPKTTNYSLVTQQLTPNSIIESVNKGLTEGGAISVASTILDENGFSQLNRGKLSVRLNNNGTHVYSFLQDDKINGSLQALRNIVTNDDVIGLTNEKGSYTQIGYRGDGSNYYNYMRFDKEKLTQQVPITIFEEIDINGLNMYFDKKNQESRMFGYLDSRNRGSVALYTNNFGIWSNNGSGNHLLTLDRDVANFYNKVIIGGDLSVIGNKNCIQQTKFGDVPFYANEDINSLLTETDTDNIYTTELVEGKYICRIEIDEIIQECINTTLSYNVYIDKLSWGDYKVEIREKDYFIVESDREMKFKYKLEGKRKGFEDKNKINNFMNEANIKKPFNTSAPSISLEEQEVLHKKPINEFWELYRCNNCN